MENVFAQFHRPLQSLPHPCGGYPGLEGADALHDDMGWLLPMIAQLSELKMGDIRVTHGVHDVTAPPMFRGSEGDFMGMRE